MKKINFVAVCIMCSNLVFSQLTGVITVPSANYPSVSAVIDSLNQQGPGNGGVVFEITGGQIFDSPLLNLTATGTQNNPITIRWNGTGIKPILKFTGTAAAGEAGFTLMGTDYFNLENIEIQVLNNMVEHGILLSNVNSTNACQNNIFKNLTITLDKTNTNQTEGIRVVSNPVPTSQSGTHANNKFLNNTIQNCIIGYNFDSGTGDVTLMAFGNEVGTIDNGVSLINDISLCGVYLKGQNGAKVYNTIISNLERIGTGSTAPAGIATASNNPTANLTGEFEFYNNLMQNHHSGITSIFGFYLNARKSTHRLYNNQIINITATGGGTNTASGIMVFGTNIVAKIYNNMISGIAAPASAVSGLPATRGIELRTFSECHVYYNSVKLNYTATNTANSSGAITVINDSDPVFLKNNIFINTTTLADSPTGVAAAFYKSSTSLTNIQTTSTNNLYFAGNPSINHPIYFGYNATTPGIGTNLSEYQALAANFDQTAFSGNINFISDINLHVNPADINIRAKAVPVNDPFIINLDLDMLPRDTQTPDLGADELIELFPLTTFNPFPTDGSTLVPIQLDSVNWDYQNDNLHILPAGFKVYKSTNQDFNNSIHAWVPYLQNQTHYSLPSMAQVELDYNTTYYWKVVPTADQNNGPDAQNVPVWEFTTIPFVNPFPNNAINPYPGNLNTQVPVVLDSIAWDFIPDEEFTLPTGFKIFKSISPDFNGQDQHSWVPYINGQTHYYTNAMAQVELDYNSSYYWKVVPSVNENNGPDAQNVPIWTFTTIPFVFPYPYVVSNPFPAINQLSAPVTTDSLAWQYVHDTNYLLPFAFKVYFGTNPNLTNNEFAGYTTYNSNQENYYLLLESDSLEYETVYYWKIVSVADSLNGAINPNGITWSFTTEIDNNIQESNLAQQISFYPNPAKEKIQFTNAQNCTVSIFSSDGSLIVSKLITNTNCILSFNGIAPGMYFLRIASKKENINYKLIIK